MLRLACDNGPGNSRTVRHTQHFQLSTTKFPIAEARHYYVQQRYVCAPFNELHPKLIAQHEIIFAHYLLISLNPMLGDDLIVHIYASQTTPICTY